MPSFTIQPDSFDLEFDVYCATCGHGLCLMSSTDEKRGRFSVHVEACPKCLERAEDRGRDSVA